MISRLSVSALVLWGTVACSSSSAGGPDGDKSDSSAFDSSGFEGGFDSGADTTPQGDGPDCAAFTGECPSGCEAALGFPLDEVRNCIAAEQQLGCRPFGSHLSTYTCVKQISTGVAYRIPDELEPITSDWSHSCTDAETKMAKDLSVPMCAADAGTD